MKAFNEFPVEKDDDEEVRIIEKLEDLYDPRDNDQKQ